MSADLLAGNVQDPQSLNRYSYVRNDPTNLVDPLGLRFFWWLWCRPVGFTESKPNWEEGGIFTLESFFCELIPLGPFEGAEDGFEPPDKTSVLRRILGSKECANLFGGLQKALNAILKTQYGPASEAPPDIRLGFENNQGWRAFTESYAAPGSKAPARVARVDTWLGPGFFTDSRPDQELEQLHELFHGVGYGSEDMIPQLGTVVDPKDSEGHLSQLDKLCPPSEVATTTSTVGGWIE
jgi:hypothetical protein